MNKPFAEYSVEDVQKWLDGIGLSQLKPIFKLNAVSGEDLLTLSHADLVNHLDATELQARKIRNQIGILTGQPPPAATGASIAFATSPPTLPQSRTSFNNTGVYGGSSGNAKSFSKGALYMDSPQAPAVAQGMPAVDSVAVPIPPPSYGQPTVVVVPAQDPNLVCGCRFQVFMLILGFFFGIPWYVGAFARCGKCAPYDPRLDRCPWIANIVLSIIETASIIAIIVLVVNASNSGYYYYG